LSGSGPCACAMRRKPKRAALPIVRQKRRKNWSTNLA